MNRIRSNSYHTIFFLTIFWISGFFFFPTGQSHNQAFILIFVLPAIWLMYKLKIEFKPFLKSKLFWITFIYCSYYAISTLWGTYRNFNLLLSEIKRSLYLYAFWLVIFTSYYLDCRRLLLLAKYIVLLGLASILYNLVVFYGVDQNSLYERFNGFGRLRNPLWVGAMYGAVAIMLFCITLQPKQANKPLYFVLFITFFIANLITHSRGPILSMLAVLLLAFFSSQLPLKLKAQLFVVFLLLATACVAYLSIYYQSDIERGQSYRLDLWLGFLKIAKTKLILGHGAGVNVYIVAPGQFVNGWSHFHNVYLGSLIELGLLGLFLHLVLVLYAVAVGWRFRNNFTVNIALMVFIFTCLIGVTYGQGIVTRINAQWIIFWLPLTILIMRELEENGVEKPLTNTCQ